MIKMIVCGILDLYDYFDLNSTILLGFKMIVCGILDLYDYFDLNSTILLGSFHSSIGLLITCNIQTN